ncbi:MAG: hypothetical protein HRU26_04685, partial [Psychroserpens sp.]|nr:hypothetical protein [Psychroserpens sp.]
AADMFGRSIQLDPDFLPAKTNLILAEMLQDKINDINGEQAAMEKLDQIPYIDNKIYTDILILSKLIFTEDKRAVKKLVAKGSVISEYNYLHVTSGGKMASAPKEVVSEKYSGVDFNKLKFFGIKQPYTYASSGTGIKVKRQSNIGHVIYEVNNNNYFVEIDDATYETSKRITLSSSISELTNTYGLPDAIHKFGEEIYYIYRSNKTIFSTRNDKIIKIILFS